MSNQDSEKSPAQTVTPKPSAKLASKAEAKKIAVEASKEAERAEHGFKVAEHHPVPLNPPKKIQGDSKALAELAKNQKRPVSVTSLRGILKSGEVVTEKDFKGGRAIIDSLLKSGHIVKF